MGYSPSVKRQQLMEDKAVIGEGVRMASASQKAIELDDVLFTIDSFNPNRIDKRDDEDDEDDWENEKALSVTAHRVIQINYKMRYIRMRCANGYEDMVDFGSNGCSPKKVYHDLADVRRELKTRLKAAKNSALIARQDAVNKVFALERFAKSIDALDVPLPAKIV